MVVKVKAYFKRRKDGTPYKVRSHPRRKRSLGKNIKFEKIGTFFVAHDDKGNFRGSKVVSLKPKKVVKKKERVPVDDLNRKFRNNLLTFEELVEKRKKREGV